MSRPYRGGPGGFARPENALKRADELENVGQKQAALQALHDVVTSKKHRTWSKTYESIMFKLIDLCVEMKKRNQAKEALMQYRNMCQTVAITSLEEVIKYYLQKATEKAEEAQGQAAVRLGADARCFAARKRSYALSATPSVAASDLGALRTGRKSSQSIFQPGRVVSRRLVVINAAYSSYRHVVTVRIPAAAPCKRMRPLALLTARTTQRP